MKTGRSLRELFSFPGFVAAATLKGEFGDPKMRIVSLRRRKKQRCARTAAIAAAAATTNACSVPATRSEEHTSELQSLMRTSYAVFCLKKNPHKKEQLPSLHLLLHVLTSRL